MPRYTYVALDSRGQESTGLVDASSTNEAIGQLRQAGYFPTNVCEEGVGHRPGRDGSTAGCEDSTRGTSSRQQEHRPLPAENG